jgi:hypothetical protein
LKYGDAFGYSDLLRVMGPEYLGEIRVKDQDVECMMIENPDTVLALYERKIL